MRTRLLRPGHAPLPVVTGVGRHAAAPAIAAGVAEAIGKAAGEAGQAKGLAVRVVGNCLHFERLDGLGGDPAVPGLVMSFSLSSRSREGHALRIGLEGENPATGGGRRGEFALTVRGRKPGAAGPPEIVLAFDAGEDPATILDRIGERLGQAGFSYDRDPDPPGGLLPRAPPGGDAPAAIMLSVRYERIAKGKGGEWTWSVALARD
ncbi:MAG: hypothetical protein ACC662_07475 [Planctomycetota bacterium]